MNILFLSLLDFSSLNERSIYTDLLRKFRDNGHFIYAVSPVERRKSGETSLIDEDDCKILKLKIGNIQKQTILKREFLY